MNEYEYSAFSQGGEDGIIEEIFKRIQPQRKTFVEIGTGNGLECNTTYLLAKGWSGYWVEADDKKYGEAMEKFKFLLKEDKLRLAKERINVENVEPAFEKLAVPKELDLLSIDIDGNDYWVWKAIKNYNPRVVVIEYNATYRPPIEWVMKYNPKHFWDKTSYQGASLKSLEKLGNSKGYELVATTKSGVNAFFVREDLIEVGFVKAHFDPPFIAEEKYNPPDYEMKPGFGEFVIK